MIPSDQELLQLIRPNSYPKSKIKKYSKSLKNIESLSGPSLPNSRSLQDYAQSRIPTPMSQKIKIKIDACFCSDHRCERRFVYCIQMINEMMVVEISFHYSCDPFR